MPDDPDDVERRLDLAVQDPANRKLSAVKVAAKLGVEVGLIGGRRDETILIRFRWPSGRRLAQPTRLRDLFAEDWRRAQG